MIPLEEGSARRRGLCLAINTHKRIRNPSKRGALDCAATGKGISFHLASKYFNVSYLNLKAYWI